MYYFDNPGGMIPSWLVNWAAKVSKGYRKWQSLANLFQTMNSLHSYLSSMCWAELIFSETDISAFLAFTQSHIYSLTIVCSHDNSLN